MCIFVCCHLRKHFAEFFSVRPEKTKAQSSRNVDCMVWFRIKETKAKSRPNMCSLQEQKAQGKFSDTAISKRKAFSGDSMWKRAETEKRMRKQVFFLLALKLFFCIGNLTFCLTTTIHLLCWYQKHIISCLTVAESPKKNSNCFSARG